MIVIYLTYSPSIFIDKLTSFSLLNKENKRQYKIVELWNIDTFEGGGVSRSVFLEKRSLEFEKINTGNFFIIKNLTIEQAINRIKDGNLPSMISYGMGFGNQIKDYVLPLYSDYGVRKDLIKYGKQNNINFAIPYILGGYSIIGNAQKYDNMEKVENINVFTSENISPSKVLELNNYSINQTNLGSFDLYQDYVKGKIDIFLGTQRDVFRCVNRNNNDSNLQSIFKPLGNYSDLIQFISILDNENFEICSQFLTYLTGEECQKKIANISMFNVLQKNYYEDEFYRSYQTVLNGELSSKYVFGG